MYKLILGLLVSLTCVTATAAQKDVLDRIYDRSDRVHSLIRQKAHLLGSEEQRQLIERLRSVEVLLDRGGRPDPFPPGGNPPPPPPHERVYLVRGDIEARSFTFEVVDLFSLHTKCSSFVREQFGSSSSVDDINLSVDFGPTRKLRNNASFWRGEAAICAQINEVARAEGIAYRGPEVTYMGTVEEKSYLFRGLSLLDINRQCESFIQQNGISSVDEITVSINLGPLKALRNSSSYWTGSFEICQQILQQKQ